MAKGLIKCLALATGLIAWIGWGSGGPSRTVLVPPDAQAAGPSSGNSFGSGIKDGWNKLTQWATPKKEPPPEPFDEALSLNTQKKPGVGVYVAVARLYEQSGKLNEAEKNYQQALRESANDLAALLGYARLLEQLGKPEEAVKLYQRAARVYPNDAAVFNNLGLCHARCRLHDEALAAFGRAILLQPRNALYRNNIATVLVETGRMQEAFSHLRSAHGDAAAYYNLGYLLNKQGKTQEAMRHFEAALRLDPSLAQARQWIERLQPAPAGPATAGPDEPSPGPAQAAGSPAGPPLRVGNRHLTADSPDSAAEHIPSVRPPFTAPLPPARQEPPSNRRIVWPAETFGAPFVPPEPSVPVRLPPPTLPGPLEPQMAPLPGGVHDRQAAPLPPPSGQGPAMRPLPRVE